MPRGGFFSVLGRNQGVELGSCGAALFAVAAGSAAPLAMAGARSRELLRSAAPMDLCSCLLVHHLCLPFPAAISPTPPVAPNTLPNVFEKIPCAIWLCFSNLACVLTKTFIISLYDMVFNCCPSKLNKSVLCNCQLQPWQHIVVGANVDQG